MDVIGRDYPPVFTPIQRKFDNRLIIKTKNRLKTQPIHGLSPA